MSSSQFELPEFITPARARAVFNFMDRACLLMSNCMTVGCALVLYTLGCWFAALMYDAVLHHGHVCPDCRRTLYTTLTIMVCVAVSILIACVLATIVDAFGRRAKQR